MTEEQRTQINLCIHEIISSCEGNPEQASDRRQEAGEEIERIIAQIEREAARAAARAAVSAALENALNSGDGSYRP